MKNEIVKVKSNNDYAKKKELLGLSCDQSRGMLINRYSSWGAGPCINRKIS